MTQMEASLHRVEGLANGNPQEKYNCNVDGKHIIVLILKLLQAFFITCLWHIVYFVMGHMFYIKCYNKKEEKRRSNTNLYYTLFVCRERGGLLTSERNANYSSSQGILCFPFYLL